MADKINKAEQLIVRLFQENSNSPLSFNEMIISAAVPRKEKQSVKETISAMISAGKLIKSGKKFKLTSKPVLNDNVRSSSSSELIEGIFDATPLSKDLTYAFVRTAKGDYFVSVEDTLNAYHSDKVAIEPKTGRKGKSYGIVRNIIQRANQNMAGDIKKLGAKQIFISTNNKIHNWFELTEKTEAKDGEKVVVEVTNWGNPQSGKLPGAKVIEILGKSGDPDVELVAVLRQYNLPLVFSDEVLQEADSMSESIDQSEYSKRTDHRSLFTFTIDPASAKDFDDAISIEKLSDSWVLYVHIADVAHYVKIGSMLFQEASARGNSFYFPKKVIPMLPERLSNRICSLRPAEEKLTLTVRTTIDPKGKITGQKMYESVIRSDYRLTYDEVDQYIDGSNVPEDVVLRTALDESRALSRVLSSKRKAAGYLFFDLPEVEYHYDDEGFIRDFILANETESHLLIENFMLVANEFTARILSRLSPTTIYRIHEDPDWTKVEKLTNLLSYYGIKFKLLENMNKSMQALLEGFPGLPYHRVFDRMVLRSLKKAKYSTDHIRHFGLSMEDYTHFTSPIRRMCDLTIHHLCKIHVIKSSNDQIGSSLLVDIAQNSTERELLADESEREINRIYKLSYMKDKVGQDYTGVVIGTNSAGLIVQLNEIPITGILLKTSFKGSGYIHMDQEQRYVNKRTGYYYQLMDKVMVTVMQVSDDVYFEFSHDEYNHLHESEFTPANKPEIRKASSAKKNGSGMTKRFDVKATRTKVDKYKTRDSKKRNR